MNEAAVARRQRIIVATHAHFISFVKRSRGDRLKGDEGLIFSGEIWTGKEALEYGLVDGVETDMEGFLEKKFGKGLKIVLMKGEQNFLGYILNREAKIEATVGEMMAEVMDQMEDWLH